jgi:hypothetical protein
MQKVAAAEAVLEPDKPDKPREEFTCPICMEIFPGRVAQCKDGHLICLACYYKLKTPKVCPSCRTPMPDFIRNRAVENMVAEVKTKCKWRGCTHVCPVPEMSGHQEFCDHQPRPCGLHGCTWRGYGDEVVDHCNTRHEKDVVTLTGNKYRLNLSKKLQEDFSRAFIHQKKAYFLSWYAWDDKCPSLGLLCVVASFEEQRVRFRLTLHDGDDQMSMDTRTVSTLYHNGGCDQFWKTLQMDQEGAEGRYLVLEFL